MHHQEAGSKAVVLEKRLRRAATRQRRRVDPDATLISGPPHHATDHRLGHPDLAGVRLDVYDLDRPDGFAPVPVAEGGREPDPDLVEQTDDDETVGIGLRLLQLRAKIRARQAARQQETSSLPFHLGDGFGPQAGDELQVGGIRLPGVLHLARSALELSDPGQDRATPPMSRLVLSDRGKLLLGQARQALDDL